MRSRQSVPDALIRLAALQDGALNTAQMTGNGMSHDVLARLLRERRWRRIAHGVYFAGPGEPPWAALAWGGLLVAGPAARLGAEPSAHLHGLVEEPLPIEILAARQIHTVGPWIFRRDRSGSRSRTSVGNPPRLPVGTAVLDLADQQTESAVVDLLTTAGQKGLIRPARLLAELGDRRRHRHRALLTGILDDLAAGAESVLEVRYLHDVERAHGLPVGQRQKSRAGLTYRSDVGYDDQLLLVELDGRQGHTGTSKFADQDRDNLFALRGWLTLRFGWFDVVDHPCRVAAQVAAALTARGWNGLLERCTRCALVPEAELWSA